MDEVQAMTRAGESVGKAVGTGLRAARRGAVRAGQVGADAAVQLAGKAETKLAERGVTADQLRGVFVETADALAGKAEEVEKSTRKTRKKLAKQRKQLAKRGGQARADLMGKADGLRKDVAKAAVRARKDAKVRAKDVRKAAKQARKDFARDNSKSHRRWPWVLGILAAGAVAGYIALTKRPEEVHLHEEPVAPTTTTPTPAPTPKPTDIPTRTADAEHARNGQVADRKACHQPSSRQQPRDRTAVSRLRCVRGLEGRASSSNPRQRSPGRENPPTHTLRTGYDSFGSLEGTVDNSFE